MKEIREIKDVQEMKFVQEMKDVPGDEDQQKFLSTVATWFFEFFTFNIVTEKKAYILGCSESEIINTIN